MKYLGLCLLALFCFCPVVHAKYLVVTADQVNITSDGIFVAYNGSPMAVESINVSMNGYLVAIPKPMVDICPNCGNNTYKQGKFCSICGFPDDARSNARDR